MFIDVGSDIFRQIIIAIQNNNNNKNSSQQSEVLKVTLKENIQILKNLKNYFNENIKKTGKFYKCVYPGISDRFEWVYNYESHIKRIARQNEN